MLKDSSKPKPAAKKPAKNLGGPWRLIGATLLIFLISQLIGLLVIGLVMKIAYPNHHVSIDNNITAQFGYILIAEALAAYFAITLVKRRGFNLAAIGLGRRPNRNDLLKALIGFGVFFVLLIVASSIIGSLSPNTINQKQDVGFANINTGGENLLAFISLVILPPLGEEILMRGYLFSGLRKIWRFAPALLATSVLFGAAHLAESDSGVLWAAGADTFLLSVVLCYLRERTGALYAGMLVHMANNLLAFLVVIK